MRDFNETELFDIAGKKYYLDLNQLSDFVKLEKTSTVDDVLGDKSDETPEDVYGQIVDITKWETVKVLVETVLNENSIIDEAMGIDRISKELSIPFRLSFNTLLINKLIKEDGK
jgi:hypothetical protein